MHSKSEIFTPLSVSAEKNARVNLNRRFGRSLRAGLILLFLAGQRAPAAPASKPALIPQPKKILHFAPDRQAIMTTSLAVGNAGNFWIGTESAGPWHCVIQSAGVKLVPLKLRNVSRRGLPLPVNVYAAGVDRQGRVWLGSLRHGVCVLSGARARLYTSIPGLGPDGRSISGPLGNRIFAIAVSPVDGSVWIGTDCGLSRWEPHRRRWVYYTAADGLPAGAVSAIAFAPDGSLYVGFQTAGLAVGSSDNHYKTWRRIGGPRHIPITATGRGLPCPYVNAITIAILPLGRLSPPYVVYVGTDDGLAIGTHRGRQWRFIRGINYLLKDRYMYPPAKRPPPALRPPAQDLMSSDYVTALADEPDGTIWIGHRKTGVDILAPAASGGRNHLDGTFTRVAILNHDFISAIATVPDAGTLVGVYGSGVYWFKTPAGLMRVVARRVLRRQTAAASLPPPALPTSAYLKALIHIFKAGFGPPADVAPLGYDWSTQGDWLGHYGLTYARLCCGTTNFADAQEQFFGGVGGCDILREQSPYPQYFNQGDWACYVAATDSKFRSVLYFPDARQRIEGEWNDAGGRYPRLSDGPDMWLSVRIPRGLFALSFYFHNIRAQSGLNKLRDYVVMVYPGGGTPIHALRHEKPLATSRISQFFGGAYCRFLLKGPGNFQVRLKRNYGFWMPVQGMFLDRLTDPNLDAAYHRLDGLPVSNYAPPPFSPTPHIVSSPAWRLWRLTEQPGAWSPTDLKLRRQARIAAYRYAADHHYPHLLLRRWRWELHLWNHNDSLRFNSLMHHLNNR